MDPEKPPVHDEEKGKVAKAILAGDDPSSKMWMLSISHADKHDADMVERWKDDMDGILIYTGVFSATVAAFLIESYKSLKPDPSDLSSRLLQQIAQELVGVANGNQLTPPTLEPFSPPRYAIHVNIFWFLSLCVALSCGLAATLVQQWVRRYLKLTRESETPKHRVRVRTFLFAGIRDFHVRLVVENISLLLHLAIFLFFAGLVEFLFNINHEVAHFVVAVVGLFAAAYIIATSLPVIYQQCPFQTPLTSVIWYITHIGTIVFLSPFSCSSHIRTMIEQLWNHTKDGFDNHIMNSVKLQKNLDKEAVRMTLGMCRGDSEIEAFLDAVPGYLQIDDNVGTRVDDIGSLLKPKGTDMPLGERMVHLFSSCIDGDGKMDDVARRHRAITCSHVIFELSMAVSSVQFKGLTLDLPKAVGHKLQHLSRDHDPKIAFAAIRTIAVLERALLDQLLDDRMDPNKRAELAKVLVAAIGEDDPVSTRYQNGLLSVNRPDGRLIAVTEFTSSILKLLSQEWQPSRHNIEHIKLTFRELCRGLNGRDFSSASQEHFVRVLRETWEAHLDSAPTKASTDNQPSSDAYHWAIIEALQSLVLTLNAELLTLNAEFIALLNSIQTHS